MVDHVTLQVAQLACHFHVFVYVAQFKCCRTALDEPQLWIRRSGYYPDPKLRLIKRGAATFELRDVHEDMKMAGELGHLKGDMIHHAYPTLDSFIEHANRYSSLGADMVARERKVGFSVVNIVFRPMVRFIWAYFFRGGFLDGREGLLVLMNHAAYVSWKYAKAWEKQKPTSHHGGTETRRRTELGSR